MKKYTLLTLLVSVLLCSCKKDEKKNDPAPVEENEIITTVQIEFKDSSNNITTTYKWENLGGYGFGSTITVDTIKLSASKTYLASVLLLNKTNPLAVDTISNEVMQLKNEHQFFYESSANLNLSSSYLNTDKDDNGVPVGLFPKFNTGITSNGNLQITLKHQPGVKPKTGLGDKNQGSTDVMVSFPVVIQ